MNILGAFEQFDPLSGTIPSGYPELFSHVLDRARKIIHRRNRKELNAILRLINGMIMNGQPTSMNKHLINSKEKTIDLNFSAAIKMHLEVLDQKGIAQFRDLNLTWAEIFAYLALILIAQLQDMDDAELSQVGITNDGTIKPMNNFLIELSIYALEAISFAEELNTQNKRKNRRNSSEDTTTRKEYLNIND